MFRQFPNSSTWQFFKWSRDCAPKPFQLFNLAGMKMSTIVCASRNCYLRDRSYLWLGKLIELGTAIILPSTVIPLPAELLLQKEMIHVMLRNTLEFTSIHQQLQLRFHKHCCKTNYWISTPLYCVSIRLAALKYNLRVYLSESYELYDDLVSLCSFTWKGGVGLQNTWKVTKGNWKGLMV